MYTTSDVKRMYERYPYPSPMAGDTLIADNVNMISSLFPEDNLVNKKILDAGCGTGHRLMAVAKRYRKARILGIDMTSTSLEIAKKNAKKNRLENVTFQRANILELDLQEKFDIIYSSGVVHHLEDPGKGLRNLCNHLNGDGIVIIWHYHPLGEHQRLLDRELLLTLTRNDNENLSERFNTMRALNLNLETRRYGSSSSQNGDEVSQASIDADAYMHPIVNAYRFKEGIDMFKSCAVHWAAVNALNTLATSKFIDLADVSSDSSRELCVQSLDLFQDEKLIKKYQNLDKLDKLAVIEILLKPTGFTIVAGKYDSYLRLGKRIEGNLFLLNTENQGKEKLAAIKSDLSLEGYTDFEF